MGGRWDKKGRERKQNESRGGKEGRKERGSKKRQKKTVGMERQ